MVNLKLLPSVLLPVAMLSGCAALPSDNAHPASLAELGVVSDTVDRRSEFRPLFCDALSKDAADHACAHELWRLSDEPPVDARLLTLSDKAGGESGADSPQSDTPLFVLVGGAFGGCFGENSVAWPGIEGQLARLGIPFLRAEVISRSSSAANSALIRQQASAAAADNQSIVLIGYSKGLVDSMMAVSGDSAFAERVQAVVGIAGPYAGSALANIGVAPYEALFDESFAEHCRPGDGGVLSSLTVAAVQPFADLPQRYPTIRFYSVPAWPSSPRLAWLLEPATQVLAVHHPVNDGQVGLPESLLPGVHLLGVVNADHWGVALPIEEGDAGLFSNTEAAQFPRDVLLTSVVRFVAQDLEVLSETEVNQ